MVRGVGFRESQALKVPVLRSWSPGGRITRFFEKERGKWELAERESWIVNRQMGALVDSIQVANELAVLPGLLEEDP